jgi:hypothetical protein
MRQLHTALIAADKLRDSGIFRNLCHLFQALNLVPTKFFFARPAPLSDLEIDTCAQ